MSRQITDSTLALAGIFQAATLVQHVATRGIAEDPYFTTSIGSIFQLEANNVISIFEDVRQLQLGLRSLLAVFNKQTQQNPHEALDVTRYVIGLIYLERKFIKNKRMVALLREKISDIQRKTDYFAITHDNIISALADAYHDTLSQFNYRIHVNGQSDYLHQAHYFERIRALLLAGIRASVLWRQCGGNRLQLLLKRNLIVKTAATLLDECSGGK